MKSKLDSYRLTQAGGAMLILLLVAVVLLVAGPKHDEVPAFVVIAVVLAMFAMGSSPGGIRSAGRGRRTLREHRQQFHPSERIASHDPEAPADDELWRHERERRERAHPQ